MTEIHLKMPPGKKPAQQPAQQPPQQPPQQPAAWRGSGGPISFTLVVAGATMLLVGMLGLIWFWHAYVDQPPPPKAEMPSYLTMRPPSVFVTTPAQPILPDNGGTHAKERAYEEALAHETRQTYVPAKPASPEAASPKPASPEPVSPGAPPIVLPPVAAPDAPPWRRYAVAAPPAAGKPRVVIVIDDMGLDKKRTARVAALPGPLTLSYLTYADDLGAQTQAARRAGHELMLHVAMEPNDKSIDPGPNVLLTGAHAADIRQRLDWGLGRFQGYVGVNNHMGSRFTREEAGMDAVMREMAKRGLLFLDSRTSGKTVAAAAARRHRVPFEERNVFLDSVDVAGEAEARLKELESFAQSHGHAIAIGHPKDKTIAALAAWLPTLAEKGLVLSPVSAVVAEREAALYAKK